ncbi:MAG: energy-coupling factor transporter transmembrane component T [Candidatus Zixiibacteriota bacterium]
MFQTRPILLGQYRPIDSFVHHLDARAKLLPVTLVLVLALLTDSALFYVAVLLALVGGLLGSGVGIRTLAGNFQPILILVLITLLYHLLFSNRDSEVLWEAGGFKLTVGALEAAAFFSLRLLLFVAVAFLVTLTSSPSELADTFARLLHPLRRIRVPVHDLAIILFLAIRFIPVLYEEFTTIRNAQMARGVRFTGSLVSRLRKSLAIIMPVFVAALQRADELALAIQARGYGRTEVRTYYTRSRFGFREWLFVGGAAALILALYIVTG